MTTPRPLPVQDAMPTTRGLNFYLEDPNLEFVCSTLMDGPTLERARPHLVALGAVAGDDLEALAAQADRQGPVLRAWDERGRRVDEIVFHPSYREMERLAFGRFGLAALSHRDGVLGWPGRVPHVVKYALSYLFSQSEFGLLCPVNMTDSTARMLRRHGSAELQARYLPRLTTTDPAEGGGARGGARRGGPPAGTRGLAMFLAPKVLPDGTKNAWIINRLKDKLGSRSMATGEVTYTGAVAYVVGELGRGFKQMMEMVNGSRLSNAMRAAGIMRRCVLESLVHARGRAAFGGALAALPLLRASLLEMLLDAEAAASVVLNGAALFDGADAGRAEDARLLRAWTPIAKGWITARARWVASEAMNVRAGNGYTEEWPNARLLRDSYLGAIWEGTTSIVALDVQRAVLKDGAFAPLAGFITRRLETVGEPAAKPGADLVRTALAEIAERTLARPRPPKPQRRAHP